MDIIDSSKKASEFPRFIINSIAQSLIKKKLKIDTSIDISDLAIEDYEKTVAIKLYAEAIVPKNEIMKLFLNSKGE